MKIYQNEAFEGERALFMTRDALIERCRFHDGESPLKESKDLTVRETSFEWKYPLWYCKSVEVFDSNFNPNARAGIWYTKGISLDQCQFDAPKLFRRCTGIRILNSEFTDAQETLWWNDSVALDTVVVRNAPYFMMQSKNVVVDHLDLEGNYAFDGCENVVIRNSVLHTKDAFWNCKNVEVENSYIEGEYFGWNSENVVLRHCEIHSHQGFCYMKNITLIDCRLVNTDLAFEYCSKIDADIVSDVDAIKNPISGRIRCGKIGELIFDDPAIDPSKTEITYVE